jgi:phosphodiesterase/alkaline phosphatase D-like protein
MSIDQMDALKDWLATLQASRCDAGRPKVIVTGTPIAPWFSCAKGDEGQALCGDGWQRFPDSLAELLHFIADAQIQQVLFLSGDYHLHADADLVLQAPGKPAVTARSIVTGGLYSPYPFANATRDEWLVGTSAQGLQAGATQWGYTLRTSLPGCGYTRLTLSDEPDAQGQQVRADFVAV